MSTHVACPNGHSWERPADASDGAAACPVCGAAPDPPSGAVPSETVALPPPAAAGEAATLPPNGASAAVPARTEVPGYEILRELGRGGMGVVYQARQIKLNRVVALKMILGGGHAGEADLARFRTEAEAIARLQHPNIVQIFEVGEHDGLPFFSLEFCGGSLDRKLAGTPLPPKEAAALIEKLARAMHAAHQRGVIHRDLKPANVLLAEDGTPKITDFGLARKLDEAGQTRTGAVMGTPSYMAPEQAGGKKAIGPAADIYALGAILYECLTGRPPFKAATPLDTILQVLADEPVPPARLTAGVPRDLETVCLKCLHKEPARRYGSAEEMAEDLRRFGAGEPVRARPVGRWGRAVKWVRRNPAVAGLLAAVVVALLGGAAVSMGFAVTAAHNAEQARQNEITARANEEKAVKTAGDLEKANDQLLTIVARSLLRPLALYGPKELTDPEIEALWELASSTNDRLGVRFVEEALRGPGPTRQLTDRAAYALHAAVGLDSDRRKRVEQLLGERLGATGVSPEQQLDVARSLCRFGIQDSALAGRVVLLFTEAIPNWRTEGDPLWSSEEFLVAAGRLEPKEAIAVLSWAMHKTGNPGALRSLAWGLSAAAARLGPREAPAAAATLYQSMSWTRDSFALRSLAEGLSAASGRLEPKEAIAVLSQAMTRTGDAEALRSLARGLTAAAGRLEPKEAAATLSRAMTRTRRPSLLRPLAQALSAVAARLEPKEAAAVCARAAAILSRALVEATDDSAVPRTARGLTVQDVAVVLTVVAPPGAREAGVAAGLGWFSLMTGARGPDAVPALAEGLTAVAAHLEAKEAAAIADALSQAMSKTTDPGALGPLAECVSAVAGRLESAEAAAVCTRVAVILTPRLARATDADALRALARGLTAVAGRLSPKEAAAAVKALSRARAREKAGDLAERPLAECLPAVAARLGPKEALAALCEPISRTRDADALRSLAQGVRAAAARLEPEDAAAALRSLAQQDVTAGATRLEPEDAPAAADILSEAMYKARHPNVLEPLAEGLAAAAERLEPKEAIAALSRAMNRGTSPDALRPLARGLTAAASRLTPAEAAATAAVLSRDIRRTRNSSELLPLAGSLAAVATRLEPGEAAAALSRAMNDITDPFALWLLEDGLKAVAGRLKPGEASVIATALSQAISRRAALASRPDELCLFADGLSAVVARQEPEEAAAVCARAADALSQAMSRWAAHSSGTAHVPRRNLAIALAMVAAHMKPGEAAVVCARVAADLSQAMSRTKDMNEMLSLADGLAAVAARLEPKEAAVVCAPAVAALLRAMAKRLDKRQDARPLGAAETRVQAEDVLVILLREGSWHTTSRRHRLTGAIGTLSDPASLLVAPALLHSALEPLPPPLPAQTLVDLLKQPLCVGEARRLVLGQLGRHYGRSFADQWEFVEYAQKQKLDLDLTSPPKRPEPLDATK